jgi:hypothetical protein
VFVPQLLELHARGRLPVERLIRTYGFGEFARALQVPGPAARSSL